MGIMNKGSMENSDLLKKLVRKRPFLLYELDQDNQLLSTNEPGFDSGDKAPILFMSIGSGEFVYHYRKAISDNVLQRINSIILKIESQNKAGSYEEWEYISNLFTGNTDFKIESGPAFFIPDEMNCDGEIIKVGLNNQDVLKNNFKYTWKNLEHLMPCSAKVINGRAVAICRSVRKHENVLECGVDTVEAFRSMGYGSSVVAHWAKCVWENRQIPCYSTQWDNEASMALAKKIKLRQYAIDITINFRKSIKERN